MNTMAEAKQYLKDNCDKGVNCPCCSQFVKIYQRPITSSMALALIILYKEGPGYHHWGNLIDKKGYSNCVNSGDKSKMVYWGLIEKKKGTRDDGSKRNGYYQITNRGKDFVEMKISVPEHAYIYNGKFLKFDDQLVSIQDSLSEKFNYKELMGDYYVEPNNLKIKQEKLI